MPGLLYELLTVGSTPEVLISANYSLPLTVFGGLWLFTVVSVWTRDARDAMPMSSAALAGEMEVLGCEGAPSYAVLAKSPPADGRTATGAPGIEGGGRFDADGP